MLSMCYQVTGLQYTEVEIFGMSQLICWTQCHWVLLCLGTYQCLKTDEEKCTNSQWIGPVNTICLAFISGPCGP